MGLAVSFFPVNSSKLLDGILSLVSVVMSHPSRMLCSFVRSDISRCRYLKRNSRPKISVSEIGVGMGQSSFEEQPGLDTSA